MIALRALGKREVSQLSPFNLVMLLLIPEIVQQGMIREDFSITNAIIGLSTLFALIYLTSLLTHRFSKAEDLIEGVPTILVSHGQFIMDNMNENRISPNEVYAEMHRSGLSKVEQLQWAVLEADGKMSFIPYERGETETIRTSKQKVE